jgi:type I restriction enzyme, S subunit
MQKAKNQPPRNKWEMLPFEQAAIPQSDQGKRVKQRNYLSDGRLPVIDQGQAFIGGYVDDPRLAFEGELPVILFGDHTRTVKFVDRPFAVGAEGIKIFRPSALVTPKYLFHWMRAAKLPDRGYGRHYQYLRQLKIPVPPIAEQERIVAEIEKQFSCIDEAVANLKRVKANLKRYKAAVLKAAVEGRLVPTEAELARKEGRTYETGEQLLAGILKERRAAWEKQNAGNRKKKYIAPQLPDTSNLSGLPEGWAWAALEMVGQESRPIIYGIIKPGAHIPGGVPYVRVTEMKDGRVDLQSLKRTSHERAAKFARATLQGGDVLISKDGTIGRVAIVPMELEGGNITQHVMRVPIHTSIWRDYAVWAIRSDFCQKWLTGETKGVALRGVNVEDFRRLPIPVPPIKEQKRIAAEIASRLSIADELETQINANLQRGERLRQTILQQAFQSEPST